MSFCVDGEANSIKVSATWAQYKRENREGQTDYKGNSLLVWQRYVRGDIIDVPLKIGPIKAKAPDPEFPDIYVQEQIRKWNIHYVVTLFLVNAQEELRPKDEYHIFQHNLVASGVAELLSLLNIPQCHLRRKRNGLRGGERTPTHPGSPTEQGEPEEQEQRTPSPSSS